VAVWKKKMNEVPAFAEDAAQHFRERENKLAVRDLVADGICDPITGLASSALMAGGAEVAGFAGESTKFFVTTIRALEACKTCGEVAAPEKCTDGINGILT
jgi:hypothetical protein